MDCTNEPAFMCYTLTQPSLSKDIISSVLIMLQENVEEVQLFPSDHTTDSKGCFNI